MKKIKKRYEMHASYFVCAALLILFMIPLVSEEQAHSMTKRKHVVLLGASVGEGWKIESLPERINQGDYARYRFEYAGDYQFDKTQTLRKILQRKQDKPDAIILKECAAYFPGDFERYQALMKSWIKECRDAGVIPVPTTVIPVAKATSLRAITKDLVRPLLGKATSSVRLKALLHYNDWIKSYAKQEKLTVLDLESPLRISAEDWSLRADLHSGDGLHLNAQAYSLLDRIVIPVIDQAFRTK